MPIFQRTDVGILSVFGRDTRELLQRLTTNDVLAKPDGAVVGNVFTNEKGRVIDAVTMLLGPGSVLLVTAGPAKTLGEWIARMTFREDVKTGDGSAAYRLVSVTGGAASSLGLFAEEAALAPGNSVSLTRDGQNLVLARGVVGFVDGLHIIGPRKLVDGLPWPQALASDADYEDWRIEHGAPRFGRELGEDYNPHEALLGDVIDWKKGCYIGQEVVARLDTYKKVQRHLVKLSLSEPVAAGTPLVLGGEEVGKVTSVSSRLQALGYVRVKAENAAAYSAGPATATLR